MKKRKSIGLYAILAIPTSIRRDKQLSGLLDSDYIDNYKKKMYISFRNSMYLTSNFSIIRTWKTHKGCQNFLDKVINCSQLDIQHIQFMTKIIKINLIGIILFLKL